LNVILSAPKDPAAAETITAVSHFFTELDGQARRYIATRYDRPDTRNLTPDTRF
jgi:hypothetical protein